MGALFQGDELLIILVILLLILGPTKLPALARGLGQAVREFRKASSGFYDEEHSTANASKPPKGLAPTSPEPKQSEAESGREVDEALIKKLAEKLGVETEGKSPEQLKAEVIDKAKKKGLL